MVPDAIEGWLMLVGLGAMRTVPMTWLLPPLGGQHVPPQVRVGLGLALALLVLPLLEGVVLPPMGSAGLLLLLAREALVGVIFGLVLSFAFRAAEAAGRLTDILRGGMASEVLTPDGEQRTSPLGNLTLFLAITVFLELGGIPRVLEAMVRGYEAVPVAGALSVAGLGTAAETLIVSAARLLEAAVGLAAPAIVAFLVTEAMLGVLARSVPQLPIYFVAMPIKALLGIGVTLVALGAISAQLEAGPFAFGGWFRLASAAIGRLGS